MILCNFSNTDYSLEWYDYKWGNLNAYLKGKTDGIELLLHGNYNISHIPDNIVKGLHLSYFPTWLNSYKNDENYREEIIEKYKKEYEVAKKLKVKYMVFHISHVELKDAFYFKYDYNNLDVINGVIDIVNSVFSDDSDIDLLFENLWWPGLTLLSKEELDYVIENINYKNSGVMLDLSHLILTNKNIKNSILYHSAKSLFNKDLSEIELKKQLEPFYRNVTDSIEVKKIDKLLNRYIALQPGAKAPDFKVYDGKEVKMFSDYFGKPIYLYFWMSDSDDSSWNYDITIKYNYLKNKYPEIDFISVFLDFPELWELNKKESGATGIQLSSDYRIIKNKYLIPYSSAFVLIDKNGNIVEANTNWPGSEKLTNKLNKLK